MDAEKQRELEARAKEIRKLTIEEIGTLGVGHIGGAMSVVELLALLYFHKMRIDPGNARMEDRDWLVMSKGHAGPALYAALALRGYFPMDWLSTLNRGGTRLPSHCDRNRTPGIDMTTGSLGQGFSAAVGIALSHSIDKKEARTFAVIGDGESDEGQVWEAAMFAGNRKLSRLVAFTDYNKQQLDGFTKDIADLSDIEGKWRSFGWNVLRCDGHDIAALDTAIDAACAQREKPSMIIMDTIKGKGCFFAEGLPSNHNMNYTLEQAREAIEKLGA
ncbi:MAG: transketolase [Treponema sp. GWB1_62_6]|nr:MAG: transketolase [Treponema sp. GWC1_61_84]OHE70998.1 MAG: transketolase [Treponema sp. GWB1_62_6]OHE74481.1 MAG: transketolase [Treponema sp. RIFOXYC1_FULL_61_9]HCM25662.1 transketolase [Treponema sp.]